MVAIPTWRASVCPYCGVGCGVDVGIAEGRVVAVQGTQDHPVNRGDLCQLGRNLVDILDTPDRLDAPMERRAEGFCPIPWPEATDAIAARLRSILDAHGPDAFAMYVSASEYIEEYYVYSKLVKGCLGTNNLESSARLCWSSGVVGLERAFGADAPPCAYDDVDEADLFFVAGYNLSASKPILFKRLMRARAERHTGLLVVDPRRTAIAARADLHLCIRPGTDVALHNAIAHVLLRDGLVDRAVVADLTQNLDALAAHVARTSPADAARVTGVPEGDIVRAAHMVGEAPAALFLWGQGLNQSRFGTRKVTTLLNLVFLTNNLGRPGAGPLAVTGQTSAMSLREVGAMPHLLPGFRKVEDAASRAEMERLWGLPSGAISPNRGKTLPDILEAIEAGNIRALWVIHANPAATFPDSSWVERVLAKTELLIVQDCYHPTETSRFAHYVLPAAQWAEKGGTMTNSERGLTLAEKAVDPPGQARPDLEIVLEVGRKLGYGALLDFADDEAVFEEYKRCTAGRANDMTGVSYARLRVEKGIQWPVPTPDHPGTKRRFVDRQFPAGKLTLHLHEHEEPSEVPDEEYPLLLITGVVPNQFHSRTRTRHAPGLQRTSDGVCVELHASDAAALGIQDGDTVLVTSRRGATRARVRVTSDNRRGAAFMPYHFGSVNELTQRAFDELAKQPAYKSCAVRVESILPG